MRAGSASSRTRRLRSSRRCGCVSGPLVVEPLAHTTLTSSLHAQLQYGTFTKSVVIKKGPLSLKGMVVAPPITFSLDPSAFSKTATLKSVPQDYTAPFARRNAADDWTLGFDDSTFTVPLDAAVLHLKPRKLQQLHQALEMHWSAGKKERGA